VVAVVTLEEDPDDRDQGADNEERAHDPIAEVSGAKFW